MPSCENCGSHVTEDYTRVFGDNGDRVHGCPNCRKQESMFGGAGVDPDYESRTPLPSSRTEAGES